MGLFGILKNTVEGIGETAINVATAPVKMVVGDPDALNDIEKSLKKIGKDKRWYD